MRPEPPTELIAENCWLAQRYGVLAFLGNTAGEGRQDIKEYAAGLVEDLAEEAQTLGCEPELRHALHRVRNGTGADRQIDHFRVPGRGVAAGVQRRRSSLRVCSCPSALSRQI